MTPAAEANRRLARLAIGWFAIDSALVEETLRAVQERQRDGDTVDFLNALLAANVINQDQANRLRENHAPTEIYTIAASEEDTGQPKRTKLDPPPANGTDANEPTQIGPYRILRRLGQGGMGAVYLAFDSAKNRQVAVKVLAAEQAPKQNILRRFQLEGQNGALLGHPNIVRTYDMGQESGAGLHYIVLEFVDGPSAHELLDRAGKLQVGDALHIILDIARALEHAHKNQIIHRDIKPANILLTASGLAKLSDLGLAKRRDDSANLTHATQGIGTPYYMPYEQAMNAKKADERSDIYALGATLFHLLTGQVPFTGDTPLEIVEQKGLGVFPPANTLNPEVPGKLESILTRMLARDPENRYQTVSEVIVDLERSQLAAVIPSFVSVDSALQDPVVVQRLMSPIEATQPDLQMQQALADKEAKSQQPWFLRYQDRRGTLCKSKATTAEILDRLHKRTIPTHAEAARSAQGKFKPLAKWPEFQQEIAAIPAGTQANQRRAKPAAKPAAELEAPSQSGQRWWWIAAGVLGVGILAIILVTVFLVVRSA
jgi:serine/threonine protein kinase